MLPLEAKSPRGPIAVHAVLQFIVDVVVLEGSAASEFLAKWWSARAAGLVCDEHFTVDGMLLEAWASLKSFQPKDQKDCASPDDAGNPAVDFNGQKRSNETHELKTDPDAKLARKGPGKEAGALSQQV